MSNVVLCLALAAPGPHHLSDLLAEAREKNPELRAALAEAKAARADVSPAGALDDPTLMVQLWNAPVDLSSVPVMFQLSQNLPLGGKRGLRRRAAQAEARRTEGDALARVRDILEQVAVAYFDLFTADRTLEVDQGIETTLRSLAVAARSRLAAGRGELADELEAQAELLKTRSDEAAARAAQASASVRLAALLDRPPDEPIGETAAPTTLPSLPTLAALRHRALAARPELASARAAIEVAQVKVSLARASRVPDLGLSAADMHAFGGAGPGVHDFLFLGVSGNLPLFFGEKNGPEIAAAEARALSLGEAERALQSRIAAEVAQAYAELSAEDEQVKLHHQLVPLAEEALQSLLSSYEAGRADFLRVLESERDLEAHELDLATHLAAYEERLAALEHAVGEDLGLAREAESGEREGHPLPARGATP
ncbi:MAG: TolC family protein [Deltaproteobacteria bacterium]